MRQGTARVVPRLLGLYLPVGGRNSVEVIAAVDRHRQAIVACVLGVGEPACDVIEGCKAIATSGTQEKTVVLPMGVSAPDDEVECARSHESVAVFARAPGAGEQLHDGPDAWTTF